MKKLCCGFVGGFLILWGHSLLAQQNITDKIKVFFNHPVDASRSTGVKATYITNTLSDTMSAYVNRAKYTIDVAQYDYYASGTDQVARFATAINNAYARGVKIRWICDGAAPNTGLALLNPNIHVLPSPTGNSYNIMHNKFIIIDVNAPDSTKAIVWTGSSDWSDWMNTDDYNNNLSVQSKQLAQAYTQEFDIMWGDTTHGGPPNLSQSKFGPFKPSISRHQFIIGGSKVELYFSPTDSVNKQILNHIATANTDIYCAMYAFSQDADANAMVSAQKNGVFAACILDQYSLNYNTYNTLSNYLGANLALYAGQDIYHNKYMIVDPSNPCSDPVVLTGSHNWTSAANTTNDENTLIIHNDTIANMYYQSFAEDFKVISDNPLDTVHTNCNLGIAPLNTVNIEISASPNPYARKTMISYTLPAREKVSVNICDVMGRKISTLVDNAMQAAGEHRIEFKGRPAAGVYLLYIQVGQHLYIKKLVQAE